MVFTSVDALGNVDLLDPDQEAAIAEFEFLSHEAEEEDHREPPSRPEEEFSQGMDASMLFPVTSVVIIF